MTKIKMGIGVRLRAAQGAQRRSRGSSDTEQRPDGGATATADWLLCRSAGADDSCW